MRLRDQLDRHVAHLQAYRAHHLPWLRHAARILPQAAEPGLYLPWLCLLWTNPRSSGRARPLEEHQLCAHHVVAPTVCSHHVLTMCSPTTPILVAGLRGVRDHLGRQIAHGSALLGAYPLRPAQPPSREDRRAPGEALYLLWLDPNPLAMAIRGSTDHACTSHGATSYCGR